MPKYFTVDHRRSSLCISVYFCISLCHHLVTAAKPASSYPAHPPPHSILAACLCFLPAVRTRSVCGSGRPERDGGAGSRLLHWRISLAVGHTPFLQGDLFVRVHVLLFPLWLVLCPSLSFFVLRCCPLVWFCLVLSCSVPILSIQLGLFSSSSALCSLLPPFSICTCNC